LQYFSSFCRARYGRRVDFLFTYLSAKNIGKKKLQQKKKKCDGCFDVFIKEVKHRLLKIFFLRLQQQQQVKMTCDLFQNKIY
jgi:hypothetical protein